MPMYEKGYDAILTFYTEYKSLKSLLEHWKDDPLRRNATATQMKTLLTLFAAFLNHTLALRTKKENRLLGTHEARRIMERLGEEPTFADVLKMLNLIDMGDHCKIELL